MHVTAEDCSQMHSVTTGIRVNLASPKRNSCADGPTCLSTLGEVGIVYLIIIFKGKVLGIASGPGILYTGSTQMNAPSKESSYNYSQGSPHKIDRIGRLMDNCLTG